MKMGRLCARLLLCALFCGSVSAYSVRAPEGFVSGPGEAPGTTTSSPGHSESGKATSGQSATTEQPASSSQRQPVTRSLEAALADQPAVWHLLGRRLKTEPGLRQLTPAASVETFRYDVGLPTPAGARPAGVYPAGSTVGQLRRRGRRGRKGRLSRKERLRRRERKERFRRKGRKGRKGRKQRRGRRGQKGRRYAGQRVDAEARVGRPPTTVSPVAYRRAPETRQPRQNDTDLSQHTTMNWHKLWSSQVHAGGRRSRSVARIRSYCKRVLHRMDKWSPSQQRTCVTYLTKHNGKAWPVRKGYKYVGRQ